MVLQLRARLRLARHRPADAHADLTHRVATLAALGYSNTEIAQQLYVTRRTVETHLTHALQKLGVATRAQLGTFLGDDADPAPRQAAAAQARGARPTPTPWPSGAYHQPKQPRSGTGSIPSPSVSRVAHDR
jgi:DNA-binding CsgD family transcriptional regulator